MREICSDGIFDKDIGCLKMGLMPFTACLLSREPRYSAFISTGSSVHIHWFQRSYLLVSAFISTGSSVHFHWFQRSYPLVPAFISTGSIEDVTFTPFSRDWRFYCGRFAKDAISSS
ncbi:hypothetical protein DPMN_124133 [Dreissena polymorpha]|uniref:Uncharacterized protein n=1 Tax=Dreissena polymorpha TaxID=45954 RepID=A0A9D4GSN1_DREPO|nr:hypothetical protein DPMN_124133 [Dreissena polymorpha]